MIGNVLHHVLPLGSGFVITLIVGSRHRIAVFSETRQTRATVQQVEPHTNHYRCGVTHGQLPTTIMTPA